jgi:predicted transcriptional regulator
MAARRSPARLSRLELEIMQVFWAHGALSVREVLDRLPARRRPAFTTVQTIVRRLKDKGAVTQSRKIGNAFVFAPAVDERTAYRKVIDEVLRLFGGDARPLVSHLAESGRLGLEDLRAAEQVLRRR